MAVFRKKVSNFYLKSFIGHWAVPKAKDTSLNLRKEKNVAPYFGILNEARIINKTSKKHILKIIFCILYAHSTSESSSVTEAWLVMK